MLVQSKQNILVMYSLLDSISEYIVSEKSVF